MNESEFFKKIREAGGRGYLAGGAVRDMVMGRAAHDRDYLVCGMLPDEFTALFPEARRAGKSALCLRWWGYCVIIPESGKLGIFGQH